MVAILIGRICLELDTENLVSSAVSLVRMEWATVGTGKQHPHFLAQSQWILKQESTT